MKDIPVKVNGNTVSASEYNSATQEEKNLVTDTGQTLIEADNFQVSKSVSNYAASGDFYTDSGTPTAYVLSAQGSKQNPTAYVSGLRVRFLPTNTNTGTATVNVGGLGVKSIKTYSNHDPVGGEIQQGLVATLEYDGTNFRLSDHHQNVIINSSFINGLLMSNNAGDPQHDIDLTVGSCSDSGNNFILVNRTAAFSKRLDAVWAAGSGNGGRASAVSLTADTWYHYFGIAKVDGTFDAGFDTSITATNLLSDASTYTFYSYLGSVLTDGSSDILPFVNQQSSFGRLFLWKTFVLDVNTTNPGTAAVLATISVPLDVYNLAIIQARLIYVGAGTASTHGRISSPLVNDQAASASAEAPLDAIKVATTPAVLHAGRAVMQVLTNTSSQIRYRLDVSDADVSIEIGVTGWYMQ